jgi:hypothetical protein
MAIGQSKISINKDKNDCLLNLDFSEKGLTNKNNVKNNGTLNTLVLSKPLQMQQVFFPGPNSDPNAGGFGAKLMFDGIACNDSHMTLKLGGAESFFRFSTPKREMWQSESTIEFWFKITDKSVYTASEKFYILSMRDSGGKYPYYEVFVQNGVLFCAPFGSASINDSKLSFNLFGARNEDQFGWWHVSCSYSFQKVARGTLFNSNVDDKQSISLGGNSSFFPQDSL